MSIAASRRSLLSQTICVPTSHIGNIFYMISGHMQRQLSVIGDALSTEKLRTLFYKSGVERKVLYE